MLDKQLNLPAGFVVLNNIIPGVAVDLKYSHTDNICGVVIDGYQSAIRDVAVCTLEAANALKIAQKLLVEQGLQLIIYDAYRPARACKFFKKFFSHEHYNVALNEDLKQRFYPDIEYFDLMNGYFAEYSKHSRGSTIDVGLLTLDGAELDMGVEFDYLGPAGHTFNDLISKNTQKNRELLVQVMDKAGFDNYHREWWHFELRDEPFKRRPQDHFDFVL